MRARVDRVNERLGDLRLDEIRSDLELRRRKPRRLPNWAQARNRLHLVHLLSRLRQVGSVRHVESSGLGNVSPEVEHLNG
jgi:hypothetical protein